jgi:flagellar L-ring protein precursor FlgH
MKNKLVTLIFLVLSLVSCSDTMDKLKRVGKAPEFAKVELPPTDADSVDSEQMAVIYEDRKKKTNSLWQPGSTSFFRDNRAWKVGDIVKVVVKISDSAQLDNSSKQSRSGSDSLSAPAVFGKERGIAKFLSATANPSSLVSTNSKNNHSGAGNISRKEAIQTVIAAVVSQILNNGNLVIQGKQEVRVNHELREVKVTGIIRPRDISAENSVSSDQIAEARISYGGRGIVSDVQQPRIGSQIVDIVSPF